MWAGAAAAAAAASATAFAARGGSGSRSICRLAAVATRVVTHTPAAPLPRAATGWWLLAAVTRGSRSVHVPARTPPPALRRGHGSLRRRLSTAPSAPEPGPGAGQGSTTSETLRDRNVRVGLYGAAIAISVLGLSYAAVPLYQLFCQATGYGGTTQQADADKFKSVRPVEGARQLTIFFNADTTDTMPWTFKPQQAAVKVVPGETALAFYTAYNPSDRAITGVSTYNVTPARAGVYFNKIQCFCFEEQRLKPREEIDMPVFFYIDPAFLDDPTMQRVNSITLSYTFFRSTSDNEEVEELAVAQSRPSLPAGAAVLASHPAAAGDRRAEVQAWTAAVASQVGLAAPAAAAGAGAVAAVAVAPR